MNLSWICKIFGHSMQFDSSDIMGASHCSRCPHCEPAKEWPRSVPMLKCKPDCVCTCKRNNPPDNK